MARILFIQCTEPAAYPPLINASLCFADAGHESLFLSAPITGKTLEMPPHAAIQVLPMPIRPSHVIGKGFYLRYVARAIRLARQSRPDLIYASDPSGALPGALASLACGAPLLYHEHDSPDHEADLNPVFREGRRLALRRAVRVVFPNAARAESVAVETGFDRRKLAVVWNLPRRREVPAATSHADQPLILYYHGTIVPDRLPVSVVEALLRFDGAVQLRFAGYETASGVGHSARLQQLAADAGLPDCVSALGEFSRHQLMDVAREAHIGLALMPPGNADINMRYMTGASNKAFDYLASGLGLLVSDLPDWQEMYVAPGFARACDPREVDSLVAQIRWFLDHPAARAAMGAAGRARILADWNYETAFAPLQRALGLGDPLSPQA
ncbi:MAG: glycosyltransferase [Xanthomonadales bacterium]|jgi:glycosyltransferase involved in cell wall biosynthesis|nr:glycosyltransferase [Xanthomonadales bacterium]